MRRLIASSPSGPAGLQAGACGAAVGKTGGGTVDELRTHYSGRVVANLGAPSAEHMRAANSSSHILRTRWLAEAAAQCQMPDGKTVDATFRALEADLRAASCARARQLIRALGSGWIFPRNMTMPSSNAIKSGQFRIGGDIPITAWGSAAMRKPGRGIWGEPRSVRSDPHPEADSRARREPHRYRPMPMGGCIGAAHREALYPYGDLLVATKGGLARTGPDQWIPLGRPEYLIQQARRAVASLARSSRSVCVATAPHRSEGAGVPVHEQFLDAIKSLLPDGVIRHAGLSEVSVRDRSRLKNSQGDHVQNRYNWSFATARTCWSTAGGHGSGSYPGFRWRPATSPGRAPVLTPVARRHGAARARLPLPGYSRHTVMLPIPGHIEALRISKKTSTPWMSRCQTRNSRALS